MKNKFKLNLVIKVLITVSVVCGLLVEIAFISVKLYIHDTIKNNYDKKVSYWRETASLQNGGGIVFVGDSIIEDFLFDEFFPNAEIYNRGIYGDTSIGVLNRMNESIYLLSPSKVFIAIGTNDLDKTNDSIETIADRIEQIVKNTKLNTQNTQIFICSLLPVNDSK